MIKNSTKAAITMKLGHVSICLLTSLLLSSVDIFAQPEAITIDILTTFDYPASGNSTQPQKISDRGDIAGLFVDSSGGTRGFVRYKNGTFSAPIIEPSDTANYTTARDVNDSRLICGEFGTSADGTYHGYFLSGATFTQYDVTGATSTFLLGINDAGDFSGAFDIGSDPRQGFVDIGGSVLAFSVPDALSTIPYAINNSDQTAGRYTDTGLAQHGFFRDADGNLTFPIDPPGSTLTTLFGINDSERMVGRFVDGSGITHAFLFQMPNKFFVYDFPGATFTSFNGINSAGIICGRYEDSSGIGHGIVARVRRGPGAESTQVRIPASPARPINPASSAARGAPPPS